MRGRGSYQDVLETIGRFFFTPILEFTAAIIFKWAPNFAIQRNIIEIIAFQSDQIHS